MSGVSFWVVIGIIGLGTLAMRIVPMLAHGRIETPPTLQRLLRHVPAATLAALAIPGSVWLKADGAYTVSPERVVALVVASVVAFRTKSVFLTIAVGMVALWILQALF
jgi:branched-subunit amino acid transport protein